VVIPDDETGNHVNTDDLRNALVAANPGVRSGSD